MVYISKTRKKVKYWTKMGSVTGKLYTGSLGF